MFDPYRKWLGILPKDQPPNHYRLLGIELFENDLDVIEGAADKQMGFVRQYQSGEYASEAAQILNELAIARLCLLKPATKGAYDKNLRQEQAAAVPEPEIPDLPSSYADDLPVLKPRKKRSKSGGVLSAVPPELRKIVVGAAIACLLLVVFLASRGGQRAVPPPQEPSIVAEPVVPKTEAVSKPLVVNKADPSANGPTSAVASSKTDETPLPPKTDGGPPSDAFLWKESNLVAEPDGKPVDLLKLVDVKRDVVKGDWQPTSTGWVGGKFSQIYLPAKLPEDYQLKFTVRRIEEIDSLQIGFVMGGRQGVMLFDGWGATLSALFLDGQEFPDNCTIRRGKLFQGNSPATIVLTVHPGHFQATFDGQTIVNWFGDPERLYTHSAWVPASRESVYIAPFNAKYVIESAIMAPIQPEPGPQPLAALDQSVDILPLIDLDRDMQMGIWSINKNTLSSPDGKGKIYVPTVVPEEYTLSATVELPMEYDGGYALIFGLVAGKSYFQITSTNVANGIDTIDGVRWENNETRLSGPFLKPRIPVRFDCTVTRNQIRMEADGKTVMDWRGDRRRLSVPVDWSLADGRRLFLASSRHLKFRDIKIGPPVMPPTLPEHPPFSIGKSLDLLAIIDPKRDAYTGIWERDGTSLRCLGNAFTNQLVIPVELPEEYQLTMRVTRLEGGKSTREALNFGLPIGNVKLNIQIDAYDSTVSGPFLDFREVRDVPQSYRGAPVTPLGTARELVIRVRKTGLQVTSDGATILDWKGNTARGWVPKDWGTPGPLVSVGSYQQAFRIEKLELEPLPPTSFPEVPPLGADGKVMSIINVDRDTRRGDWTLRDNGLLSPPDFEGSQLRLPVNPPRNYLLSAAVERRSGQDDLLLGLNVGGFPCEVSLDGNAGRNAGLERLDNKWIYDAGNLTGRKYGAGLLPQGKLVKIRCYVLADSVLLYCGDKEVIRWHGDPRRLSADSRYFPPNYSEEDRTQLWLGSWKSTFRFINLELRSLSDVEVQKLSKSFAGVFPATSQAEVPLKVIKSDPLNLPGGR